MLSINFDGAEADISLIYILVNPHVYKVDGKIFDPKIESVFQRLLSVVRKIESGCW